MRYITIKFLDAFGKSLSNQKIEVDEKEITLSSLLNNGMKIPIAPIVSNKSFVRWNMVIKGDEVTFKPKYIITKLEGEYIDSKLNMIGEDINSKFDNLKVHIIDNGKTITNTNTNVDSLFDTSQTIRNKIDYVAKSDNIIKTKLDLIEKQDIENKLSKMEKDIKVMGEYIAEKLQEQREYYSMLNKKMNDNELKLSKAKEKLNSFHKSVIMSENDYKNLVSPNKNMIYFTKEIN